MKYDQHKFLKKQYNVTTKKKHKHGVEKNRTYKYIGIIFLSTYSSEKNWLTSPNGTRTHVSCKSVGRRDNHYTTGTRHAGNIASLEV